MVSHKRFDTGENLRDFVYGFHDGMVTTLAAIVAITVAGLDNRIIILVGFANMIADGISMSLGGYLSSKSEKEYIKKLDLHPAKIALITFLSFVFAAFIPIVPYFFLPSVAALPYVIVISVASFFIVGSLRTLYTKKNWLVAGLEMLAIGVIAIIAAYLIGSYIASLNVRPI